LWLYSELDKQYDLTKTMLGERYDKEAKYLNRTIRWTAAGLELEGGPKHVDILVKEWGMCDSKEVDTPMTKDIEEKIYTGELQDENKGRTSRRAIARINYMAQDRPDLSVPSRILSHCMANPKEGVEIGIKRVIRYLRAYPRCVLLLRWHAGPATLGGWTDSDWAGDEATRRSCSGGFLMLNEVVVAHWSKMQLNIALSSGEAELNASVKCIAECIGVLSLYSEVFGVTPSTCIYTDASACKGMLLRRGAGKVKHLTTKQLWSQEALALNKISVLKVPRLENGADMLTHYVTRQEMDTHLAQMHFWRGK
jgi:hypothetical protein